MVIKYGWVRDLPDKRDFVYSAKKAKLQNEVDLSSQFTAPYDQGRLGSCTAQAMAAIYQFTFRENKKRNFMPSRLKIYYDERVLEKTVKYDCGATLRSGMKVLAKMGVCKEKFWKYNDNKNRFKRKPSKICYLRSKKHKTLKYYRVNQTLDDLCLALSSNDPVAFGFAVFDSFMTDKVANTGIVSMPNYKKESLLGGHAVVLVGYNMETKMFKVRNSWGMWGDQGYCYMPFEYITDKWLSDDFWALKKVK